MRHILMTTALLGACAPSDDPTTATTAGDVQAEMTTDYGLFIADGTTDPLAPDYQPMDFDSFFVDHFGHGPDEIEAEKQEAKDFFADTYGLDVDQLVADGRATFDEFRMDYDVNYRVRAMPGRYVQPEGWLIDDLALSVTIIDPEGVELGGQYAGMTFGPGIVGVWGYYAFDALHPDGSFDETLTIKYHSDDIPTFSVDGRGLYYCKLYSDEFGTGLARITAIIRQNEDGTTSWDVSNVQSWTK
jgi:hypothetical protein